MKFILLYFLIGFIVAIINNRLFTKLQSEEEKNSENPGMVIALFAWIVFWPLSLIGTYRMIQEVYKNSKNEK